MMGARPEDTCPVHALHYSMSEQA